MYDYNYLGLNSDYTWNEYLAPSIVPSVTNVEGSTTVITTINGGGGGQVTGSVITISGGVTGLTFVGGGQTITLQGVLDEGSGGTGATTPAGARTNLEAAKSGVNTDITQLNGASQVDVTTNYKVGGAQVVSARGAAVPDAAGGATVDAEARTAINTLLARLRAHGLIDT